MLIIYWMLMPVFIWVAIILFMWKNLRSHWRRIIVPLAVAKHCEASGNLLNAKNEIVTMPAYDGQSVIIAYQDLPLHLGIV
ncbi:unnamed protein product [Gongylonema pulchrum]|uniref:Inner membrane protein n=1 Tax=Gongylonema pulchrum TaxID=637853 RepID=A0A183DM99_9BILA|nr:unnamed protein product [Gongylonema pulchrum]